MLLKKSHLPICAAIVFGVLGYSVGHWVQVHQEQEKKRQYQRLIVDIVGQPAPTIELIDINQKVWRLSEHQNKVVIINFWATWCSPCLKEIPAFIKAQEHFGNDILEVVGISQESQAIVQQFVDKMQINYTILLDGSRSSSLGSQFGNQSGVIPYTIFLDQNHQITFVHPGELDYKTVVQYVNELTI